MKGLALVRAVIAGIALVPFVALAQTGGTADGTAVAQQGTAPAATSAPAQAASQATATPVLSPQPYPTTNSNGPQPASPAQNAGAPAQPQPTQTTQPTATNTDAAPVAIDNGTVALDDGPNLLVRGVEALLVLIPFGFLAAYFLRKKPKQESEEEQTKKRCFDIEQMLKDKLNELTDLKAMAADKATDMGKELMRDLVTGTKTGDLLVKIEKLEAEYNKLKALFEECKIDVDHYRYKGMIIENSLLDTKILDEVRVIDTRREGDWIIHDIRLSQGQIEGIQRNIADRKWYFHLWEPGKDEVTVVFKDAIFKIRHSDKSTWKKAIAHGVACGIPEAQLDFVITQ